MPPRNTPPLNKIVFCTIRDCSSFFFSGGGVLTVRTSRCSFPFSYSYLRWRRVLASYWGRRRALALQGVDSGCSEAPHMIIVQGLSISPQNCQNLKKTD